jgi:hypothetical protein
MRIAGLSAAIARDEVFNIVDVSGQHDDVRFNVSGNLAECIPRVARFPGLGYACGQSFASYELL